jgi:hypothetical protein
MALLAAVELEKIQDTHRGGHLSRPHMRAEPVLLARACLPVLLSCCVVCVSRLCLRAQEQEPWHGNSEYLNTCAIGLAHRTRPVL